MIRHFQLGLSIWIIGALLLLSQAESQADTENILPPFQVRESIGNSPYQTSQLNNPVSELISKLRKMGEPLDTIGAATEASKLAASCQSEITKRVAEATDKREVEKLASLMGRAVCGCFMDAVHWRDLKETSIGQLIKILPYNYRSIIASDGTNQVQKEGATKLLGCFSLLGEQLNYPEEKLTT